MSTYFKIVTPRVFWDRKDSPAEKEQQQQPKKNYNKSKRTTTITSTTRTTAKPQLQLCSRQLQQQNTSVDQILSPSSSSTTPAATAYTTTQHNNKPYPGLGHNATNVNGVNSTPAVKPSWARFFAKKRIKNATVDAVATRTQITHTAANAVVIAGVVSQLTATAQHGAANVRQPQLLPKQTVIKNIGSTSHSNPLFAAAKHIARVAPYDGITLVTPTPAIYSPVSAQGLPPPATAAAAATAAITNKPAKQQSVISVAIESNSVNFDECTLIFADFLTHFQTDLSLISLRPCGLTNSYNYCYINSILQALLGCSPFTNLIRAIPEEAAALSEVKTPTVNAMISFMANFSTQPNCRRLRTKKGRKGGGDLQCDPAFEPTEIYNLWNNSHEEHVEGSQEDAEEFLCYVLNMLNDEMLEMIYNNRNKDTVTHGTDFGRTPLSDIFRGELRSRLEREGALPTDVIQPFFTLQLNVKKAASLKEALEIFVGRDQLQSVTGSMSKQEVIAWQQMTIEKLPVILILHLKWFDYKYDGCRKILKKFHYPLDLVIDKKVLASNNYSKKERSYRLFAVVYHDGKKAFKGHYFTDVYHTGYESWMRFNDSCVKPVSEKRVLLPRKPRVPYLLYYRRCDSMTHAPTSNAANISIALSDREYNSG